MGDIQNIPTGPWAVKVTDTRVEIERPIVGGRECLTIGSILSERHARKLLARARREALARNALAEIGGRLVAEESASDRRPFADRCQRPVVVSRDGGTVTAAPCERLSGHEGDCRPGGIPVERVGEPRRDIDSAIAALRAVASEARDLTLADRYGYPSQAHSVLLHPDTADALIDVAKVAKRWHRRVRYDVSPVGTSTYPVASPDGAWCSCGRAARYCIELGALERLATVIEGSAPC